MMVRIRERKSEHSTAHRREDRFHPGARAQLSTSIPDVIQHCVDAEKQLIANLPGIHTPGNQTQDLQLPQGRGRPRDRSIHGYQTDGARMRNNAHRGVPLPRARGHPIRGSREFSKKVDNQATPQG